MNHEEIRYWVNRYHDLGWVSILCKCKEKLPVPKGWTDITRDDYQYKIRETLDKTRDYFNLGILSGQVSGVFVVDVDVKSGGIETLQKIADRYNDGKIDLGTVYCRSGSGGYHIYFKYEEKLQVFKTRSNIMPGIDIKTNKGFLIVPESVTKATYTWIREPFGNTLADVPDWLFSLLLYYSNNTYKEVNSSAFQIDSTTSIQKYMKTALEERANMALSRSDYYGKTNDEIWQLKIYHGRNIAEIIPQLSVQRATNYDSWIKVLFAVKGHSFTNTEDMLVNAFVKFSQKSTEKYNPEETNKTIRYQFNHARVYDADYCPIPVSKILDWYKEDVGEPFIEKKNADIEKIQNTVHLRTLTAPAPVSAVEQPIAVQNKSLLLPDNQPAKKKIKLPNEYEGRTADDIIEIKKANTQILEEIIPILLVPKSLSDKGNRFVQACKGHSYPTDYLLEKLLIYLERNGFQDSVVDIAKIYHDSPEYDCDTLVFPISLVHKWVSFEQND